MSRATEKEASRASGEGPPLGEAGVAARGGFAGRGGVEGVDRRGSVAGGRGASASRRRPSLPPAAIACFLGEEKCDTGVWGCGRFWDA